MLANILAVLLGLGSFIFYMAAFFYPEVHRRADFLWSGLGMFYAVVLWFCAGQMTGAVLLGQLVAVVLLLGLGWQTLSVRREKTPVYQQTPVVITPEVVGNWAKNQLNQLRIAPAEPIPVRLEKRKLSEFSSTDRLDPRRRPVYEYEFVEDGLVETFSRSPALDSQSFQSLQSLIPEGSLERTVEGDVADDEVAIADLEYQAPPSAIAEVLTVENPPAPSAKANIANLDTENSETANTEVLQADTSDTETLNVVSAVLESIDANATSVTESTASVDIEPKPVEASPETVNEKLEAVIQKPSQAPFQAPFLESETDELAQSPPEIDDADDWDNSPPINPSTGRQKPSLIAMPLILVGWMKEVIGSMTKPKAAKPVIVIPRREPSLRPDRPVNQPPNLSTQEPPNLSTKEFAHNGSEESSNFDAGVNDTMASNQAAWRENTADSNWDDDLEESNWDD